MRVLIAAPNAEARSAIGLLLAERAGARGGRDRLLLAESAHRGRRRPARCPRHGLGASRRRRDRRARSRPGRAGQAAARDAGPVGHRPEQSARGARSRARRGRGRIRRQGGPPDGASSGSRVRPGLKSRGARSRYRGYVPVRRRSVPTGHLGRTVERRTPQTTAGLDRPAGATRSRRVSARSATPSGVRAWTS